MRKIVATVVIVHDGTVIDEAKICRAIRYMIQRAAPQGVYTSDCEGEVDLVEGPIVATTSAYPVVKCSECGAYESKSHSFEADGQPLCASCAANYID